MTTTRKTPVTLTASVLIMLGATFALTGCGGDEDVAKPLIPAKEMTDRAKDARDQMNDKQATEAPAPEDIMGQVP